MAKPFDVPFSRPEAVALWSRLVAGWANTLNSNGNRNLMDGIPNYAETRGSYEAVTRMLWGLGSWLSYDNRPSEIEWNGRTYDIEALTKRALVNGCDPNLWDSWRHEPVPRPDWDQRTVESGQVAFAMWQTRNRLWPKMTETERNNVVDFLDQVGQKPSRWGNNWALFWVLNHTARKGVNARYDQSIIDEVLTTYMDGVYCGDGWYDDGDVKGKNYFDSYITWVFGMHVMAWAQMDGDSMPARRDELLDRIREWMVHYPYFFGADGSTVEYGRSVAYKFCRLGAPLWAYKLGIWPHSVGMLKRIVGRHLRWYVDRGAVRADGTLRQALTASGTDDVIERYISTGATYWAIQAFSGLWGLADDDPFWSAEEEPIPAEQGNFTKVHPIPGWVLSANKGHVQQFNAGVVHPGYGNKYAKLVYNSRFAFNVGMDVGQPSLDSCLCLSENGLRQQRDEIQAYAVSDTWLRSRYMIPLNGHEHIVDTTLVLLGESHLRAHRITLDPNATNVIAQEASAPMGFDAGAVPTVRREGNWLFMEFAANGVGITPLEGYSSPAQVQNGSANSVTAHNLIGVLTTPLNAQHDLICLAYAGDSAPSALPQVTLAGWDESGQFMVMVDGATIIVPALGD